MIEVLSNDTNVMNKKIMNKGYEFMQVKILKGTNQIGGVFTEISSKEAKIIIDFGDDLDGLKRLENIEGLTTGKPTYDGVFITHNHQDHMGRIDDILGVIPVYMSDLSKKIFETVFCFSKNKGNIHRKTFNLEEEKPITIKDMKITPYIVDHSAYNSFMLLIESEGKKILHTGDFRNHGYKGVLLEKTLKKIGKIDLLITEGTTFSRKQVKSKTEAELVDDIVEKTKSYDQVLMLMSTTNIDRVTTMQKVANRTGKAVIHDIVLSNVLQFVTQKIPNALNSEKIGVYLPNNVYIKRNMEEYKKYIEPFEQRIKETGKLLHGKFIMNVRVSMLKDIERLKDTVLTNCCVVYSFWEGYQKEEIYIKFLDKLKELHIDVFSLHVSGHADYTALHQVLSITNPDIVIPIHTENKEKIKDFTDKAVILDDMELFEF